MTRGAIHIDYPRQDSSVVEHPAYIQGAWIQSPVWPYLGCNINHPLSIISGPDVQSTFHALKPSPTGDWAQTVKEDLNRQSKPVLPGLELYLLSDVDSYDRLEEILAETDDSA
jgi:hypothetical protein